jgi:hypothetical protein
MRILWAGYEAHNESKEIIQDFCGKTRRKMTIRKA